MLHTHAPTQPKHASTRSSCLLAAGTKLSQLNAGLGRTNEVCSCSLQRLPQPAASRASRAAGTVAPTVLLLPYISSTPILHVRMYDADIAEVPVHRIGKAGQQAIWYAACSSGQWCGWWIGSSRREGVTVGLILRDGLMRSVLGATNLPLIHACTTTAVSPTAPTLHAATLRVSASLARVRFRDLAMPYTFARGDNSNSPEHSSPFIPQWAGLE